MVGRSDFKENPKSNLDLDLGFVNFVHPSHEFVTKSPLKHSTPSHTRKKNTYPNSMSYSFANTLILLPCMTMVLFVLLLEYLV